MLRFVLDLAEDLMPDWTWKERIAASVAVWAAIVLLFICLT